MSWHIIERDGKRYRVAAVQADGGTWVGWPGGAALCVPERTLADGSGADDQVRAPMTGKVVEVRVKPGDTVEAEQVVAVLEAMKMEYRLATPHGGQVEAVHCEAGELVDLGTTLVTVVPEE